MRRMPRDFFIHFQTACKVFFFALFSISVLTFARPAYADPHAVFYTDRAQEQFFYNSLAALNQADFVEPSLSDGTGRTREELLGRRSAAVAQNQPVTPPKQGQSENFIQEQNPLITQTHTDLPAILSRSVTLEGNDLWTAYLVNQFALETATRRSTSELARIFCERGLGRVGCSSEPKAQQQESAFITKPASLVGELKVGASAALSSGDAEAKKISQSILDGETISGANGFNNTATNDPIFKIERPEDASLAALRKNESANEETSNLINTLASSITNLGSRINPDMFSGVTFDSEGSPRVAKDATFDEYTEKLFQLASLPSELLSVRSRSEQLIRNSQAYRTNSTAVADYILESKSNDGSGSLLAKITTPASTKLAAINALAELEAEAAVNQNYTNPRSISQAGNRSLVDPSLTPSQLGTLGTTDGLPDVGSVAGISTFDQQLAEKYQENYDAPQPITLSPSVYDQGTLLEPGTFDALVAFTNDTHRRADTDNPIASKSAFSIDIKSILDPATVSAVLCSVFPSIEACLTLNSNV